MKEMGYQKGVGVESKPTVSVRSDRISGHGDMKMRGTKEAATAACSTNKA